MARYIDLDKAIERLNFSPAFPNMGTDGYFLLGVVEDLLKKQPTADVVPKSEYDRLEKLFNDMTQEAKGYLNRIYGIRADVANEIFAEIAREVYSKIPDKILPITIAEMRNPLNYEDGLNFGSRNAYFDTLKIIAELKKKYTEGANENKNL